MKIVRKAKSMLIVALVMLNATGPAVYAQSAVDVLSKIRDGKTVTIGYRESSLPFSYLDRDRKPVGYSIDLCLKIVEAIRRDLKLDRLAVTYVAVTSSTRIAAVADGKVDLECGSTTNTAERREKVAFTIPHFFAASRMLVKTDSQIHNWSDLRDKRVVTTKGTTAVKLLNDVSTARALHLQPIEARDHAQAFAQLMAGEAVAFMMDDVLLFGFRAGAIKPEILAVVGDPLSAEPYAVMLRKDDARFKSVVDREVARIILDGELEKMYSKWFLTPIPPAGKNLNMPMSFLLRDTLRFPTDKVGN